MAHLEYDVHLDGVLASISASLPKAPGCGLLHEEKGDTDLVDVGTSMEMTSDHPFAVVTLATLDHSYDNSTNDRFRGGQDTAEILP